MVWDWNRKCVKRLQYDLFLKECHSHSPTCLGCFLINHNAIYVMLNAGLIHKSGMCSKENFTELDKALPGQNEASVTNTDCTDAAPLVSCILLIHGASVNCTQLMLKSHLHSRSSVVLLHHTALNMGYLRCVSRGVPWDFTNKRIKQLEQWVIDWCAYSPTEQTELGCRDWLKPAGYPWWYIAVSVNVWMQFGLRFYEMITNDPNRIRTMVPLDYVPCNSVNWVLIDPEWLAAHGIIRYHYWVWNVSGWLQLERPYNSGALSSQ